MRGNERLGSTNYTGTTQPQEDVVLCRRHRRDGGTVPDEP
jgi:hypothetical protein